MLYLTPLEQICPLKKFEGGLQTLPSPQTPYIAYEKGKNLKFEFYSCSGQNVFQLTQKEHQRHLMENLKGFRYSTAAKCEEITIFDQKTAIWDLKCDKGSVNPIQFLFKRYNNSAVNAFWPWQKQDSDFQFSAFPIGCVGGLRWRWGLKTPKFF